MFSKNNHLLTDRQCTHQNPKFALRKLSIGVASVLLGTIFLMGEANVQADTVTDANQENPVIATTTADTQNKSTSKSNIDQAKQLINNQTTVVENEKPANPLPDYKPITYVNYDAVSIYPANDAQGNPSVYVKDHIFDNVHKPGDRVYDFIKGANGWSSGVYYYHQNKQHTAGYHALTPVDANDRSKGYQVPDFEADILGGERIALDKDGHLIGAYPGESHYSSMAPGAAVNTYITLHPDRQRAEINFLDQTTNSSLGKVVLWGYSGVQSQFKVDDLLAKLKSLGFEVTSSDFQNGFHYDSTNNDYYSSSDPNQWQDNQLQSFTIVLSHQQSTENGQKTITRTIHYKYSDGSQASPDKVQTITLTRTGSKDAVTGEITWGAWSTGSFDAVTSPTIAGYTPDYAQIDAETVDGNSTDIEQTVTYIKDQVATPDDSQGTKGNQHTKTNTTSQETDNLTKNSLTSNKQQANRLPKTGNQSETGAVALGLATMLGMLGLAGLKRKHQ